MYEPSPAANAIGIGNTSFPIGLCHIIDAESSRATSQFYYTCEAASLCVKKSADKDKRPPCTAQVEEKRQSSKRSQICLPAATPPRKTCTAIGTGNIFVTSFHIRLRSYHRHRAKDFGESNFAHHTHLPDDTSDHFVHSGHNTRTFDRDFRTSFHSVCEAMFPMAAS